MNLLCFVEGAGPCAYRPAAGGSLTDQSLEGGQSAGAEFWLHNAENRLTGAAKNACTAKK